MHLDTMSRVVSSALYPLQGCVGSIGQCTSRSNFREHSGQVHLFKLRTSALASEIPGEEISSVRTVYLIDKSWQIRRSTRNHSEVKLTTTLQVFKKSSYFKYVMAKWMNPLSACSLVISNWRRNFFYPHARYRKQYFHNLWKYKHWIKC